MEKLTPEIIRKVSTCVANNSFVEAFQLVFDGVTPGGNGMLELISSTEHELPVRISIYEKPEEGVTYADDLGVLLGEMTLDVLFDSFRYDKEHNPVRTDITVTQMAREYKNWIAWLSRLVDIFTAADTARRALTTFNV